MLISLLRKQLYLSDEHGGSMKNKKKYYVVKEKALPEVLLKVVEVNRLLATNKAMTIQEATDLAGISRSSFYKYKDDIFPFNDKSQGRTITIMLQLNDIPGLLSTILNHIAKYDVNILTIHQAIPVGGIASATISMDILPESGDVSEMIADIESLDNIHYMKILARE